MRTREEILARVDNLCRGSEDFFGFQAADLIAHLSYEDAKAFLKEGIKKEDWKVEAETPRNLILGYLSFAWGKANDCRGLSAARSLDHMKAWLWLLGDDDLAWLDQYSFYGKPQLVRISERFGFDWRSADDGLWRNCEDCDAITADQAREAGYWS